MRCDERVLESQLMIPSILLALHIGLVVFARRAWRHRGIEWTSLDTATCGVVPFALFLFWLLLSALIPSAWWPSTWSEERLRILGLTVITLPPLCLFWVGFFWLGMKKAVTFDSASAAANVHPTLSRIRFELSRWLFVIGLALLAFSVILTAALWIRAAALGDLPHQVAGHSKHGPWRGSELSDYVGKAVGLPLLAGCASLLSLLIKPTERAGVLLVVSIGAFFLILGSLFWFID